MAGLYTCAEGEGMYIFICSLSKRSVRKLANWLESYAEHLELNVWTSSTVMGATQDASKLWSVVVKRDDGSQRIFKVKHLIFAMGFKGGEGYVPIYPGMVS